MASLGKDFLLDWLQFLRMGSAVAGCLGPSDSLVELLTNKEGFVCIAQLDDETSATWRFLCDPVDLGGRDSRKTRRSVWCPGGVRQLASATGILEILSRMKSNGLNRR